MNDNRRAIVVLLDNRRLDITVQSRLTAAELGDMVASHCNLRDPDRQYFGLVYHDDRNECYWLQPERRVLDYNYPVKLASDGTAVITLHHCVKFYGDVIADIIYPSTIELFLLQAKQHLVQEKLVYNKQENLMKLLGLVLQSILGDYCSDQSTLNAVRILSLLPQSLQSSDQILGAYTGEERLLAAYKALSGVARGQAVVNFLCQIEQHPAYGLHLYEVWDKGGTPWLLGLGAGGIFQFDSTAKTSPKWTFSWKSIENLYHRGKKFSVEISDPRRVVHARSYTNLCEESGALGLEDTNNDGDGLEDAVNDPTSQISVSRRTVGPNVVRVHSFFCASDAVCKNIWNMAVAQHQFHIGRSGKTSSTRIAKTTDSVVHELNELAKSGQLFASFGDITTSAANIGTSSTSDLGSSISTPSLHSVQSTMSVKSEEEKSVVNKRFELLKLQKLECEMRLVAKINELKAVCIEEGSIVGTLSPEIMQCLAPGETLPPIQRRVGTSFTLSLDIVNKGSQKEDLLVKLEVESEIQRKIAAAAYRLANDPDISKAQRKRRRAEYLKANQKHKQLVQTLHQLRHSASQNDLSKIHNIENLPTSALQCSQPNGMIFAQNFTTPKLGRKTMRGKSAPSSPNVSVEDIPGALVNMEPWPSHQQQPNRKTCGSRLIRSPSGPGPSKDSYQSAMRNNSDHLAQRSLSEQIQSRISHVSSVPANLKSGSNERSHVLLPTATPVHYSFFGASTKVPPPIHSPTNQSGLVVLPATSQISSTHSSPATSKGRTFSGSNANNVAYNRNHLFVLPPSSMASSSAVLRMARSISQQSLNTPVSHGSSCGYDLPNSANATAGLGHLLLDSNDRLSYSSGHNSVLSGASGGVVDHEESPGRLASHGDAAAVEPLSFSKVGEQVNNAGRDQRVKKQRTGSVSNALYDEMDVVARLSVDDGNDVTPGSTYNLKNRRTSINFQSIENLRISTRARGSASCSESPTHSCCCDRDDNLSQHSRESARDSRGSRGARAPSASSRVRIPVPPTFCSDSHFRNIDGVMKDSQMSSNVDINDGHCCRVSDGSAQYTTAGTVQPVVITGNGAGSNPLGSNLLPQNSKGRITGGVHLNRAVPVNDYYGSLDRRLLRQQRQRKPPTSGVDRCRLLSSGETSHLQGSLGITGYDVTDGEHVTAKHVIIGSNINAESSTNAECASRGSLSNQSSSTSGEQFNRHPATSNRSRRNSPQNQRPISRGALNNHHSSSAVNRQHSFHSTLNSSQPRELYSGYGGSRATGICATSEFIPVKHVPNSASSVDRFAAPVPAAATIISSLATPGFGVFEGNSCNLSGRRCPRKGTLGHQDQLPVETSKPFEAADVWRYSQKFNQGSALSSPPAAGLPAADTIVPAHLLPDNSNKRSPILLPSAAIFKFPEVKQVDGPNPFQIPTPVSISELSKFGYCQNHPELSPKFAKSENIYPCTVSSDLNFVQSNSPNKRSVYSKISIGAGINNAQIGCQSSRSSGPNCGGSSRTPRVESRIARSSHGTSPQALSNPADVTNVNRKTNIPTVSDVPTRRSMEFCNETSSTIHNNNRYRLQNGWSARPQADSDTCINNSRNQSPMKSMGSASKGGRGRNLGFVGNVQETDPRQHQSTVGGEFAQEMISWLNGGLPGKTTSTDTKASSTIV